MKSGKRNYRQQGMRWKMMQVMFAVLCVLTFSSGVLAAEAIPAASAGSETDSAVELRVEKLLNAMTLEEKIDYIGGDRSVYIRPVERLGIPEIKMADGPVGIRNYGKSTLYPAGILLAASWNPELAAAYGHSVGRDARARGVHIWLGPGVNIYRAPMCGRDFEYFGEDPFLASRIAVPLIQAVQSEGVMATVKHYAGNNQEYNRHFTSSNIDERTLREIYLPVFRAAVQEAHVACVMDAYNLLNGDWCTANRHLNLDILKGDWGFDGFIMSDWESVHEIIAAANAGPDLEMPSGKYLNRSTLMPLLNAGKVSEQTLNDKVRRILRVIVRAGFLDRPQQVSTYPLNDPNSAAVALNIAREGIVLLKNDNQSLPLDATKLKSVAVIGPMGGPHVPAGGGSSRVQPFKEASTADAIRERIGELAKVEFLPVLNRIDVGKLAAVSVFEHTASDGNTLPGLYAEYYSNPDLIGAPALTRIENTINFAWEASSPFPGLRPTDISARWTGKIRPQKTGSYTLAACSDDGMRVWLNGQLVVDEWADHGPLTRQVEREFRAGETYDLKIEYFQHGASATAQVGWGQSEENSPKRAVELAKNSDVAIVCVGFGEDNEGEGSDRKFALLPEQSDLLKAIAQVNPRTIVVLYSGGSVDMQSWLPQVPALVQAWYPGQEGGRAIAEILFGDISPSGKLPATFEKRWEDNPTHDSYYPKDGKKSVDYSEGIFVGYRGYDKNNVEPQFPFGYGLSYTTFEYGTPKVQVNSEKGSPKVTVSFTLKNTGGKEAAEVAQGYLVWKNPHLRQAPKMLKAFRKIRLAPGQTEEVTLVLDEKSLSSFDPAQKKWIIDGDSFEILIGASSRDIRGKADFRLIPERNR